MHNYGDCNLIIEALSVYYVYVARGKQIKKPI